MQLQFGVGFGPCVCVCLGDVVCGFEHETVNKAMSISIFIMLESYFLFEVFDLVF